MSSFLGYENIQSRLLRKADESCYQTAVGFVDLRLF